MQVHYIPGQGFESNVFIVEAEEPFIVDAGLGYNAKHLYEKADELGIASKLKRVILTHRHIDHVGGANFISQHFKADLYASALAAEPLRLGDERTTGARDFGQQMEKLDVKVLGKRR